MPRRLEENLKKISNNIAIAAKKSNRNPNDIRIIAVTKTVSNDMISNAYIQGLRNFGENRVQELVRKYEQLASEMPEAQWHLIGHLQRNKVKYIIDKVKMIHSLDSFDLAAEIDKKAASYNKIIDVLVQVNVAEEATKFGIGLNEVEDFLHEINKMSGVQVRGLMTMAPFTMDPEETRHVFRGLKEKFEHLKTMGIPGVKMDHISMGMSNDYMVAVEEGATIVRIGSSLFKEY